MSAYLAAVLADAPKHYWRLCDPSGPFAADIGGTRLNLILVNGAVSQSYTGPVSDGGSTFFNNTGWFQSAVSETDAPPYTAEMWLYLLSIPSHDQYGVSQGVNLGVQSNTDDALLTTTGSALVSATVVTLNAWHHLAAVIAATTRTLYLDGVSIANDVHTVASVTGQFNVGAQSSGFGIVGFVAEAAWYASALTVTRLLAHKNAADQATLAPTSRGGGSFDPTTGVFVSDSALLALVYAAVHQTFL